MARKLPAAIQNGRQQPHRGDFRIQAPQAQQSGPPEAVPSAPRPRSGPRAATASPSTCTPPAGWCWGESNGWSHRTAPLELRDAPDGCRARRDLLRCRQSPCPRAGSRRTARPAARSIRGRSRPVAAEDRRQSMCRSGNRHMRRLPFPASTRFVLPSALPARWATTAPRTTAIPSAIEKLVNAICQERCRRRHRSTAPKGCNGSLTP